jgi:hypothetical protein
MADNVKYYLSEMYQNNFFLTTSTKKVKVQKL